MTALLTGNQNSSYEACSDKYLNQATSTNRVLCSDTKIVTKTCNESDQLSIKLGSAQIDILDMVKLYPSQPKSLSNNSNHPRAIGDINLQIPLSNLYHYGYLSKSQQSTFNDCDCFTDETILNNDVTNDTDDDESINSNNKLLPYHTYKYSRQERDAYYARTKHTLKKNNFSSTTNQFHSKAYTSLIFNQMHYQIHIPTKINSRQRISSKRNHIYPLLFSPHFNTLVKLSTHPLLKNYLVHIKMYFHLINSIASQEFQYVVNSYDNQHQFSFTSLSFINILRQTMYDYATNLQTTLKRNYFQTFHSENEDNDDEGDHNTHDNNQHESTLAQDNELSIPPLKIRRYDDSSYEIEKRSVSSRTSSSSGMSIVHISNNGLQSTCDDRRRLEMRPKKFPMKFSDNPINSNLNDSDNKDISNLTVASPIHCDLSILDYQPSQNGTSNDEVSYLSSSQTGELKSVKCPSPTQIRDQGNDSLPKYQSMALNDGARIRIVNCSNDNNKSSSSRNSANSTISTKTLSMSIDKIDENSTTKITRTHTRKVSSTSSKTPHISEVAPSYQPQSVVLSNSEIANRWLTHSVFYRCHVCSHEEFFVVLSRECIRLHISSKHGNMEENFKQRISNFLNNQGRALKIFQHYLKWQQPWSEREIDEIFQLSNINYRTNGAP